MNLSSIFVPSVLAGALAVSSIGCADGGTARPVDAGRDAGEARDAGSVDAPTGRDAGPEEDGGALPIPERCTPDYEFFMDEFGRQTFCVYVATTGDDATGEGTPESPYRTVGRGIEVAVARPTVR